jgi:hypothetical protein
MRGWTVSTEHLKSCSASLSVSPPPIYSGTFGPSASMFANGSYVSDMSHTGVPPRLGEGMVCESTRGGVEFQCLDRLRFKSSLTPN